MPKELKKRIKWLYFYAILELFVILTCLTCSVIMIELIFARVLTPCFGLLVIIIASSMLFLICRKILFSAKCNCYEIPIAHSNVEEIVRRLNAEDVIPSCYYAFYTYRGIKVRLMIQSVENYCTSEISTTRKRANKVLNRQYGIKGIAPMHEALRRARVNLVICNVYPMAQSKSTKGKVCIELSRNEGIINAIISRDQCVLYFPYCNVPLTYNQLVKYKASADILCSRLVETK